MWLEVIVLVLPSTFGELLDDHLSVFKPLTTDVWVVTAPSSYIVILHLVTPGCVICVNLALMVKRDLFVLFLFDCSD